MALDDVKHVEAVALIRRLLDASDQFVNDAAEGWLRDNHPAPSVYSAAARSLGTEVDEDTREFREAKVLETVREWLPEVDGYVIQIKPCDPDANDGALFSVTRTRTFVCRR